MNFNYYEECFLVVRLLMVFHETVQIECLCFECLKKVP